MAGANAAFRYGFAERMGLIVPEQGRWLISAQSAGTRFCSVSPESAFMRCAWFSAGADIAGETQVSRDDRLSGGANAGRNKLDKRLYY